MNFSSNLISLKNKAKSAQFQDFIKTYVIHAQIHLSKLKFYSLQFTYTNTYIYINS